jgi:hypothetical protein
MHTSDSPRTNARYPGQISFSAQTRTHTDSRIHTQPTPTPKCTHAHTSSLAHSSLPPHARTRTPSPSLYPPPHTRAPLHARTPVLPTLQIPHGTYWVPKGEAGRSVLPRAPNGICIHGSPQPQARGLGCVVPFPKRGAGARSAAAPGGAWARGPAPPARSAFSQTSATVRPQAPTRAPGSGGGS